MYTNEQGRRQIPTTSQNTLEQQKTGSRPHHTRSQLTILLDIHARCRVNVRIQQVDLHFVAGQQTVMQDLDPWQGVGKVEILFASSGSSMSQASHVLYTLAAR